MKRSILALIALAGAASAQPVLPVKTDATGLVVSPVNSATFKTANGISGGTGTVTSVSVTTANGISGTVATSTTTPAITLTLGVIAPTSVNGITLSGSGGASFTLGSGITLNGGPGGTLGTAAFTAATAYEVPLTFSTGLTRTVNTVTVNASQSISTLSNLTSNGPVQTTGGTGALSIGATTGSNNFVKNISPTLVTPILGTPTSGDLSNCTGTPTLTLTNATGLPISTGVSGLGSGVATFLATPSSANLASAVTDETGTAGKVVFSASPTLTGTLSIGSPAGLSFVDDGSFSQPFGTLVVDNSGNLTAGSLTSAGLVKAGAGLYTLSGAAAKFLILQSTETLTANRALTITLGDSARTLTLSGSPSISGVTITGTGTLATGTKTLTLSNSLTLAGTDSTTMTFPSTSATVARTDAAQTFTGLQTVPAFTATGAVTMTAGTASTTTGTGTLVVTGGIGASGVVNAGPGMTISGGGSGVETIFKATNDASKLAIFGTRGSASGGYGTLPNSGAEVYSNNDIGMYVDKSTTGVIDIGCGVSGSVVVRHQMSVALIGDRANHLFQGTGGDNVITVQQLSTSSGTDAAITFKDSTTEHAAIGYASNATSAAFLGKAFFEAYDGGASVAVPPMVMIQSVGSNHFRRIEVLASGTTPGNIVFYNAAATYPNETVHTIFATDGSTTHNGTLAVTGASTLTGGIIGTVAAGNATAGNLGEYVSSLVASGSAVSLTTATPANMTSISLTAGDWDVTASVSFVETVATASARSAGISTTTATLPTDGSEASCGVQSTLTSEVNSIAVSRKRINVSSTTTVYAVASATFSAGTVGAFGNVTARRIR